ncbi:HAD family hydrolase [Kribbella sp. NPDC056345]|uniref:HAD family hydrolase n=1 Tax=Kribbella sp. NPDC056345 TaxID=3345789 RepID=UPI0035D8C396
MTDSRAASDRPWLVFDIDDTLVDTFGTSVRKCATVARRLNLTPPTAQQMAQDYGRVDFRACVTRWHPTVDFATYAATYDSLVTEVPAEPLGDFAGLLTAARGAGFGVGILSNGPSRKTARKLSALGVGPGDLDFVVDAGTATEPKPARQAFEALFDLYGVNPRSCWYVSDSPEDWQGAAEAGYRTVAVPRATVFTRPGPVANLTVPGIDALRDLLSVLCCPAPSASHRLPQAWSFDAGFTLIEHLLSPAELIATECRTWGVSAEPDRIEASLSQWSHLLDRTEVLWACDRSIDEGLSHFYRLVLLSLGVADSSAAAAIIKRYTSPTNWRLRPGADTLVSRIAAAGYRLGVLANWQSSLGTVLDHVGLRGNFDAVVASAQAGAGKPSPAAFSHLASSLGIEAQAMVHVGDDPRSDVAGAIAAGARAVWAPADLSEEGWCRTVLTATGRP